MVSKRELNTNISSWIFQVGEELVQGQGRLQQMVEKLGEETKVSYLHQNPCKRIFSKKQLQEVEEHVKWNDIQIAMSKIQPNKAIAPIKLQVNLSHPG